MSTGSKVRNIPHRGPVITMKVHFVMFTPYQTVQMQIAALTSYLRHHNIEVSYSEYYIFSGENFEKHREQVREDLLREQPGIVAFSTYDMNYYYTLDCARFVKELNPGMKTIAGGHTSSVVPYEFMDHDSIDFVGKGEGEELLKELVHAFENDLPFDDIKGLYWRNDAGEVIVNEARPLIEALDELPFIDREIVELQHSKIDYLPFLMGRGCPYKCDYCGNEAIKDLAPNSSAWSRYRSPKHVIDELLLCREKYDFKYVFFYDDVFCLKIDWLQEFKELYQKHFPNTPYISLLRPEMAQDDRRMQLLAESGCMEVHMGVESGSYEYRKSMLGRKMTNEVILRACDNIKKFNMRISAFLMVGMPDESCLDMVRSLLFIWKIKPEGIQTGIFYPLKGTPSYDYCEKNGLINWKKRKEMVVYTYDTSLNVNWLKRYFIIFCKWALGAIPLLCHFKLDLIPKFFKIQYRLWILKKIDYT
jgi:anaerobic magnesium-protoporphyrin IX monomethyl ester cyclase